MGFDVSAGVPVLQWVLEEGRFERSAQELVEGLAKHLRAAGVEVHRTTVGVPLLDPQLFSFSVVAEDGKPTEYFEWRETEDLRVRFESSPLYIVYGGGGAVRVRIGDRPQPGEFPIITDLRSEGYTDYLAMPVTFSDRSPKAATFATKAPGGFSNGDLAIIDLVMPALAMALETQSLHRTSATLLETYVGRHAGRRVLAGAIRRGMGETIRAVLWMSDLRGFTNLSDTLPRDALIALLNDYFGIMTSAVEEAGGEVLKFVGDAQLAIFPVTAGISERQAALAALGAAETAAREVARLNRDRANTEAAQIRYGLALHVGDVLYGNIGGERRLDFTVIGPAVNLVCRIQDLCGPTGYPVLASAAFAGLAPNRLLPLGRYPLKGIVEEQEIHAVPGCGRDERAAPSLAAAR